MELTQPDTQLATFKPEDGVNFDPFVVRRFIDHDLIALLRMQIEQIKLDPNVWKDKKLFNRKQALNHPLFLAVHQLIHARTECWLGRHLKPSYNFVSLYTKGIGFCPRHKDRPPCRYTVDLCIDQIRPWGIFAQRLDGLKQEHMLEPGDALILSGTQHEHWREPITQDNFADMAFFHFVDPDFTGELT